MTLSDEGTSTGLPDLFTGTMSYSIPIEVPAGRKGMDPGLALSYRSGNGNGEIGVGWELELGSIQRPLPSSGTVNYTQNNFLLTKAGSTSSLVPVGNEYKTKIEGGFSRIQKLTSDVDSKPYWVVTNKTGLRFFYGQTIESRQDDPGNSNNIFKWCLNRIEDTNGNYIAVYYYKGQNQIYLDRIEYTGNTGLEPTNYINFYWEPRTDYSAVSTTGFPVTTTLRLAIIDVVAKPTSTTTSRIRTYKLTYDNSSRTVTNGSLLRSVQQFGKDGGSSLPAKTMSYDQTGTPSADYLTSFTNGIGGTTTITYSTNTLVGTIDTVQNVSSVTANDGNGKSSTTYYHYTGGYYYASENDFRGFNKVEVRGPVSDDGKQVRTETYFHQGNDTDVDVNNPAVSSGYTKGKPYRSITFAVSGVTTGDEEVAGEKISETTTSYDPVSFSVPYFTPPKQIDTYFYDGDTNYKQSRSVYDYNAYGNVINEYRYGDVDNPDDDFTIYRTYFPNYSSWIIGLPTSETVYQGIGTSNKISSTSYYYDDNSTNCASNSENQYPDKGRLIRIKRWLHYEGEADSSVEEHMAYDNYGNLTCHSDPKGYTTTSSLDPSKTFPITTINPLGQQTLTQYYGVNGVSADTGLYGQVKSVTDPNGAVTTKEYDGFGRSSKVLLADGTSVSWAYNNFGTVVSQHVRMIDSNGLWKEDYFDGFGRTYRSSKQGPELKLIETKTEFDARGAVRKTYLPYFFGEATSYVPTDYDAPGRVVRGQDNPDANTRTLICYNKDVTVKIDPNNHRRREVRDAAGRLVTVQEYKGTFSSCTTEEGTPYATTTYQYDVLGNLLFVTDAKQNRTEIKYDSLGRKRYMRDPDMGVWRYTYDANGNLETQIDAKGQTIYFNYGQLNRLLTKEYPGLMVQYHYDEPTSNNSKGRLSRMVDNTGQTVYHYDSMGRVISTTKTIDGTAYNLGFAFPNGRLGSITYPGGETVNYSYDAGVLKGATGYISYSNFDALGRPKNASYGAGGASSLYSFDPVTKRLDTLSVVSPNQGLLIDNNYGYDNKGNITSITDNLNKPLPTNFSSENYTLDPSRAHVISSTGSGRVLTPDANGNITNDGLRSFIYNYDNMPTTVNSTGFTYDGNVTRVKKSSPGSTTVYIDKLYECTNGTCTKFIFAGGNRIASKVGNQVNFYHPDHQGGTSVVTDAAGNKVDDIAYYPFGGTRQEVGSTPVSHKYTSQELDSETGLYNYNARLYDPDLGRFMTPDSIVPDPTNPQSLNRYSYVLNNPLNFTDPTGHSFWKKFLGGVELVAGAVITGASGGTLAWVGVPLMTLGAVTLGANVERAEVNVTVATIGDTGSGSNSSTSSSAGGLPIGNTGIRLVGPAEILAVDTYSLLIGQASHLYTFPRDLNNVWDALYQGNLGAAGMGVVNTALDLAIPRYGNAGGRGWGVSGNEQVGWNHTLGSSFNFPLNKTDLGSFHHDKSDIDWDWIAEQWSIGGSGRASGPFALGYKMIGTIGFGITGFRN